MAGSKRYKGAKRDGGRFVGLPLQVLESPAYLALSHPARALLLEVAMQFHGDDNGRMLLSRAHLEPRGWRSADVLQRAKGELLEAGLIFETVKGQRPNKASWYACTWWPLDRLEGFDPGALGGFERSAYLRHSGGKQAEKNAALIPSPGAARTSIAPSPGTERPSPVPSPGAMRAVFGPLSVPGDGHPLEKPSA